MPWRLVIGPGGFLHAGEDHSVAGILWLFLRPHIPVAIFGIRIAARLLKPGMLVGGVVDHQVDQHTKSALPAAVGELHKITQRAVAGIDAVVVRDIVTVVALGEG